MTQPWIPKPGDLVRTADQLTATCYRPAHLSRRLAGVAGIVVESHPDQKDPSASWALVAHDGATAPYDLSELRQDTERAARLDAERSAHAATRVGAADGLRRVLDQMGVEKPESGPTDPLRPRVGAWIEQDGVLSLHDERGVSVAWVMNFSSPDGIQRWHWLSAKPFSPPPRGQERTIEAAKAAVLAVLSTWADVRRAT